MKFVENRPLANPDLAAHKLVEIANDVETVQDGRIYIERVNAPCGTYVKFTDAGAALFA